MASIAQNPIVIAAALRTKSRRFMANLRRQRSVSASASSITIRCCRVGGSGMNSPLEHGSTSTGSRSERSSQDRLNLGVTRSLLLDLDCTPHEGVDAAVVRDNGPGLEAVLGRHRHRPVDGVLRRADVRRTNTELGGVPVEGLAEA